ncbi:hypothetical protein [Sinomicrobium sp. M5D2P17]
MRARYKIEHKELRYRGLMIWIVLLVAGTTIGVNAARMQDNTVEVSDFGALPNDGKCDRAAIKRALDYAKTVKAEELVFDVGTYDLFVSDASKNTGLDILSLHDFTMRGAINQKGNPATTFLRHYDFKNDMHGKPILSVRHSNNFRLQNIIFDNNPRYSTAGEVVTNDGESVTVKIFEGNPVIDGTLFFTSNIWDLSTKNLKKVESPTYGGDVYKKREEYTWHVVGDTANRIMQLHSPTLASKVAIGEGLSWHFSYKGIQVNFYMCNDLSVENVWTFNAIGFCMRAEACENITAKKVKIIAPDNQLAVGSRDGWKLYACRGKVVMDEIYMEGVRWDGQNVHGSFLWPYQVVDKHTIWLKKKEGAAFPIPVGSKIGFWNGKEEILRTVQKSELKPTGKKERGFLLTFTEPVPDFVNEKTLCLIYGWNIDNYMLSNSTFRNIAGSASLIRNSNVSIVNNTFDHIMYPAIMIGGAINEGEGVVPKNVRIERNKITHSGWMSRHGITGAIGIRNQEEGEELVFHTNKDPKLQERKSPWMTDVRVIGNTIEDSREGIVAKGTLGMHVRGNKFFRVKKNIDVEKESNPDVRIEGNNIK